MNLPVSTKLPLNIMEREIGPGNQLLKRVNNKSIKDIHYDGSQGQLVEEASSMGKKPLAILHINEPNE